MNLLPNGNRLADLENKLTASKGQRRRGKINWESETDIHMLPYTQEMTRKGLLCSLGNSP